MENGGQIRVIQRQFLADVADPKFAVLIPVFDDFDGPFRVFDTFIDFLDLFDFSAIQVMCQHAQKEVQLPLQTQPGQRIERISRHDFLQHCLHLPKVLHVPYRMRNLETDGRQQSFQMLALHSDPIIFPRILFIRLIIGHHIRINDEELAFFQVEAAIADFEISLSLHNDMDQKIFPDCRPETVVGSALLFAFGCVVKILVIDFFLKKIFIHFHHLGPYFCCSRCPHYRMLSLLWQTRTFICNSPPA